jgi:DME family drug/metabolite transporter
VRPELLILGAAALWGTTGTAQELADLGASPVAVGLSRIAVGGLVLAVVAARVPRHRLPAVATLVGIAAVAAYQACFFAAVDRAGVALGTMVGVGSAPVFAGVITATLRGEAPAPRWYPATGLAVVGCGLLLSSAGDTEMDGLGLLLALGVGLSYASYTVATKALIDAGVPPDRAVAALFVGGTLVLAPALFVVDTEGMLSGRGILMVLWLGVVATALAYLLFGRGLARLPPPTVATLSLNEPLTATILGVVVLGERPGALAVVGALLLLAGLVLLLEGPALRRSGSRPA